MAKKQDDVLMKAALAAVDLISRPEVQEQIAQAGSVVVGAMKQRSQRRAEERESAVAPAAEQPEGKERRPVKEALTSKFGNQKLERRVQNLSENVTLLRGSVDDAEAAEALGEVEAVVNRLEVAVAMAANLPMGKRQKAHWEIDSVLDELERAVFASVME